MNRSHEGNQRVKCVRVLRKAFLFWGLDRSQWRREPVEWWIWANGRCVDLADAPVMVVLDRVGNG